MASVTLKEVSKKWGDFTAVDNISLEVGDEEFMVLLGPSGCGKTTTMRMVAGLEEPTNGEIFIATDGEPYSSREIYEGIYHAIGKRAPTWSVPKFLFDGLSLLNPLIRYKVDKLLGDEYYSSEKLEGMDFRAEKSLRDFDKSDFSVGSSHLSRKDAKGQREK